MDQKVERGQFYTTTNPFAHKAFFEWLDIVAASTDADAPWLEPFAGANNIVEMIDGLGIRPASHWRCFDIAPCQQRDNTSGVPVEQRDTLKDYPLGFDVAITNPPYLAKNSATRRGLSFPATEHDDLYKVALETMLKHTRFVAAIIPESFLTADLWHERIHAVVSLTVKMFDDTEVPVCLAMFVPGPVKDFTVYSDKRRVGSFKRIKSKCSALLANSGLVDCVFNDPHGQIGLRAVDSTTGPSIQFVDGDDINPADVLPTSRAVTRISISGFAAKDKAATIDAANAALNRWRGASGDLFLTSFKGLRRDGKYRRRLDWANARLILSSVINYQGL